MITKWTINQLSESEELKARGLAQALNLSIIMGRILVQRGIRYLNKAKQYLKPNLRQLHDPFLMNDMQKAVLRLNEVIERKEHILIFGDYDVDGTTAVALVYNIFRDYFLPEDFLHYIIPERNDDGHGLSLTTIDRAHELGVSVIIALDCGSKAHEEISYAKKLGIDVIICDHHQTEEILPEALAMLNPKRADNTYPNADLSGCAVGFKLMQALAYSRHIALPHIKQYIELVAISIIVDLVPITGENRVFVALGLKQLNHRPSLGLRCLINKIDFGTKEIDSYDIMFKIGPRLNAAGRMYQGVTAVDLLTSTDLPTAYKQTQKLEELNDRRRLLDKQVTRQAISQAEQLKDLKQSRCLILFSEEWHQGVLGIVASRLNERYNRPALILSKKGDLLVGSARSMQDIDLYRGFEACEDLLDSFGGHRQAVGFTLKESKLEEFTIRMKDFFEHYSEEENSYQEIEIDGVLDFSEIQEGLLQEIKLLAPFGLNNKEPLFATYQMKNAGGSQLVGKKMQHLKLNLTSPEHKDAPIRGIALGLGHLTHTLEEGATFNLCYTISENNHYSQKYLELQVKDISLD